MTIIDIIKYMKAIVALQKLAVDPSIKVSFLLLQTYLIACKLDLEDIKKWAELEIKGYFDVELNKVPRYRILSGTFHTLNTSNQKKMVQHVNKEINTKIVRNNISYFENLISDGSQSVDLYVDEEVDDFLRRENPKFKNHIFYIKVSKLSIEHTLFMIRSTVLEMACVLEQKNILGEEWEFTTLEKQVAINITNFQGILGDITGGIVNQNNNLEVKVNDFDSLAIHLKKYGLEISQIQELRTILEDNPSSQSIDGYGERLKTWLGALSGSVSTELVVEAIKTFGGF